MSIYGVAFSDEMTKKKGLNFCALCDTKSVNIIHLQCELVAVIKGAYCKPLCAAYILLAA